MPWLLAGTLGACWVVLAVIGVRQGRRRVRLARFAHEVGLRFSKRDSFGLVQRYGGCELMQVGHSAHVGAVLHGRRHDWNVRLFDLDFEVGRGPNRAARTRTMVAAELPHPVPTTFVWRDGTASERIAPPSPGAMRIGGGWSCSGDLAVAEAAKDAWPAGATESIGVETAERLVLFATAGPMGPGAMERQLDAVVRCLAGLAACGRVDR